LSASTICVLVVDDYAPWRNFASGTLQKQSDLKIVDEAADGLEAVKKAQELQPDLILLDIGLPTLNGIEAAIEIREVCPMSKIVFLSENSSLDIIEKALDTSASSYVLKSDAANDLLPAVEAVLQGKQFVSTRLSQNIRMISDMESSRSKRIETAPYLLRRTLSISEFLESVMDATRADFGNVQLFDPTNRVLRIVAQQGFEAEFLNYFDTVTCDQSYACSTAMSARPRMVVADVASEPLFSSDSRGVLLRANVQSVQSTPLIDSKGRLFGMVSTHYRQRGGPMPHMWKHVDELAARFLATVNTEVSFPE
jgi:DNA-binding NarL/FixJ family response regulator